MTQTFTTDSSNDLFIAGDGNLSISAGLEGVLQACATAAKAQLGEMMFSIDTGVPNTETIWTSSGRLAQFEAYLRATLSGVSGVKEVRELTTVVDGDTVKYSATIVTIYGTGELNV
jgi:predicted TPR repeat methyltransferase